MDETPRPLFLAAAGIPGGGYRHGRQAGAASVLIHASLIALLVLLSGSSPPTSSGRQWPWRVNHVLLAPFPAAKPSDGGGGGGGRSPLAPNFGQAPRFAHQQFVPPSPLTANQSFQLLMEPTLAGPPDLPVPQVDARIWGDPTELPGPPSPGPGCCGGIGRGRGDGVGPGEGPGLGPGEGGRYTNVFLPGRGGVSAPIPLYKVEPEYSEEARKAKFQGTVVIEIIIDERGYPTNFKILNPLGLGLDEKAVEAVKQWRFRPGMKNGKPVAVVARVEVNFRLL